jgi:hypothetical protein
VSTKYERTPERWTLGSTIKEKNTSCIQTAERRAETTCFGVAFTCVETKTFVLELFHVPARHSLSEILVLHHHHFRKKCENRINLQNKSHHVPTKNGKNAGTLCDDLQRKQSHITFPHFCGNIDKQAIWPCLESHQCWDSCALPG